MLERCTNTAGVIKIYSPESINDWVPQSHGGFSSFASSIFISGCFSGSSRSFSSRCTGRDALQGTYIKWNRTTPGAEKSRLFTPRLKKVKSINLLTISHTIHGTGYIYLHENKENNYTCRSIYHTVTVDPMGYLQRKINQQM